MISWLLALLASSQVPYELLALVLGLLCFGLTYLFLFNFSTELPPCSNIISTYMLQHPC